MRENERKQRPGLNESFNYNRKKALNTKEKKLLGKSICLYDEENVEIKKVVNINHTKIIGEYSVITVNSADVNDENLADWYYSYVNKNDYLWCMILYSDKDERSGVYAVQGRLEKNIAFDEADMTDDFSKAKYFVSSDDNKTLIEFEWASIAKTRFKDDFQAAVYELVNKYNGTVSYMNTEEFAQIDLSCANKEKIVNAILTGIIKASENAEYIDEITVNITDSIDEEIGMLLVAKINGLDIEVGIGDLCIEYNLNLKTFMVRLKKVKYMDMIAIKMI